MDTNGTKLDEEGEEAKEEVETEAEAELSNQVEEKLEEEKPKEIEPPKLAPPKKTFFGMWGKKAATVEPKNDLAAIASAAIDKSKIENQNGSSSDKTGDEETKENVDPANGTEVDKPEITKEDASLSTIPEESNGLENEALEKEKVKVAEPEKKKGFGWRR